MRTFNLYVPLLYQSSTLLCAFLVHLYLQSRDFFKIKKKIFAIIRRVKFCYLVNLLVCYVTCYQCSIVIINRNTCTSFVSFIMSIQRHIFMAVIPYSLSSMSFGLIKWALLASLITPKFSDSCCVALSLYSTKYVLMCECGDGIIVKVISHVDTHILLMTLFILSLCCVVIMSIQNFSWR